MLCRADSVGVFQVESRAQMSMLPRLKPRCFYDLVIQIAIVRPGPIQGGMVHPYLKRRDGLEQLHYENDALREVLEPTLGVPIFQEQVIRLSMVAAGFSGGEADQLRRAMASWGKNGNLLQFEQKFLQGMLANGYSEDFAERLFEQVKGFGGYGFPESHSASFAILCYISSWLKCHHPAAFYCALLNSQPMGFYSPSQLIQDARRHHVVVFPVDIQNSRYESTLENTVPGASVPVWGIRLGFIQVKGLDQEKAKNIAVARADRPFESAEDILRRTSLRPADLQVLASADVLHGLLGHRYRSRWQVAGVEIDKPLFRENTPGADSLVIQAPSLQKDIASDLQTTRVSLRPHIMSVLRRETPFIACKRQSELASLSHKSFVKVAGLVTGRQRPGTANGTVFLTLEDETGNINVIVWKRTQELFRKALLNGRLLLIKGNIETDGSVVHVVAGQLHDYSDRLDQLAIRSRDFH
jgi:error-prone DNA polymerase